MMGFHKLSDAEYKQLRLKAIAELEGEEYGVYLDTAKPPQPTIGIGFNLAEPDIRDAVIADMGVDPSNTTLTTEQQAREADYQQDIIEVITTFDSAAGTADTLQTFLDTIMAERKADPLLVGVADRDDFKYKTVTEMEGTFNELIDGDVIQPNFEQKVNNWLADIPPSKERVVLLSLSFNGVLEVSNSLKAAIQNDNRAEAWYEIRYNSNAGSLDDTQPDGVEGIAKRRYIESSVFGLYDTVPENVTPEEALSIYRMYTQNRTKILAYEQRYHDDALVNAQSEGAGIGVTVSTLAQAFTPAYDLLMLEYGEDGIDIDYRDIQVADDAGEFIDGHRREGWSLSGDAPEVNDLLIGGAGNDALSGGGGNDVLIGRGGVDFLDGGAGDDVLRGGEGGDVLDGGADNDTLHGGQGDDWLYGGSGENWLYGGADDDTYILNGDGSAINHIADSEGNNRIVLNGQVVAEAIEAGAGRWTSADGRFTLERNSPLTITDNVTGEQVIVDEYQDGDYGIHLREDQNPDLSVEREIHGDLTPEDFDPETDGIQTRTDDLGNVITTDEPAPDRDDTLYDSTAADAIYGHGGDDHIDAWRGGDDYLDGGAGSDIVMGRGGDDIVIGDDGADLLRGDEGEDKLYAGEQVSLSEAFAAQNAAPTGMKGDLIDGGEGNDILVGGAGNDALNGGVGNDLILGGAGDDDIDGDMETTSATRDWSVTREVIETDTSITYQTTYNEISYVDPVEGGNDAIYAGAGDDWVRAGRGADFVDGGEGDDVIFGQEGGDTLLGGSGNDVLNGDSASVAAGEQGNDYVDGGDGDDLVFGMGGDDVLLGGDGNDQLQGGSGADSLDGGTGDDILFGQDGNDTLFGGAGIDFLAGGAGDDTLSGQAGDDELQGGDGNDRLDGGDGHDTLFGQAGDDRIFGGDGNDYLLGGAGDDYLAGGLGDDVYYHTLGEGNTRITDNGGTDWLVFTNATWSNVTGLRMGSLVLTFDDGSEVHLEDSEPDNPRSSGSIEYFQFADGTVVTEQQLIDGFGFRIDGTPGEDTLTGSGLDETIDAYESDDVVAAGGGHDTVDLGSGDDWADAGDGNDLVYGGRGDDVIFGEAGADTLYGDAGSDRLHGGDGADRLYGGDGSDWLAGGTGNDVLEGGAGADTYQFGMGDGRDVARDSDNAGSVYLAGLVEDDVVFQRQDNHLVIGIAGTSDQFTIEDWFASDDWMVTLGDGTVLDSTVVEERLVENQPPLTEADTASLAESTTDPVSLNVLDNDADPEGESLTVTNPGAYEGEYGALTLEEDGTASYVLNGDSPEVEAMRAGQTYTDSFDYTVTDEAGQTSTSTVRFQIAGENDLPEAFPDSGTVEEDGALSVSGNALSNDTDVDEGDTLQVVNTGTYEGGYGELELQADGAYTYTLDNEAAQSLGRDQTATESFDYEVTDTAGGTATSSIEITVQGTNDAPDLVTPLEDQTAAQNASFEWQVPTGAFDDVDEGDVMRYAASLADGGDLPDWLDFDETSQTFSGRVPRDAEGHLDIRVTATDSVGGEPADTDLSTSDVFRLSFEEAAGGGGGNGGNGGNGGGGREGNAGVGNGPDAPPPGHEDNFNDGEGTGPGAPGARGPNGNRPTPSVVDMKAAPSHLAPGAGAPAADTGAANVEAGGSPSQHLPGDSGQSHEVRPNRSGQVRQDAIHAWFSDTGTVPPRPLPAPAQGIAPPEEDDVRVSTHPNGAALDWERVDARLKAYPADGEEGSAAGPAQGIGLLQGAGFLGSTSVAGADPISLAGGSGHRLGAFKGLKEGLEAAS